MLEDYRAYMYAPLHIETDYVGMPVIAKTEIISQTDSFTGSGGLETEGRGCGAGF
ncbi:hypothetical protein L1857_25715 [Amycolatopsis thermalba]|uniref:Uncharacterized protein n=1 Tax=Amycolatopsis thermalba TaxID=944492 RepID=A0ABY4P0S9_9PSEU|nr:MULTISPECIES: hypothetical protein [Amycolatopsis]UQS25961.1 hypothetical protein L1857_25715 [Amycolatopsis thermalba]